MLDLNQILFFTTSIVLILAATYIVKSLKGASYNPYIAHAPGYATGYKHNSCFAATNPVIAVEVEIPWRLKVPLDSLPQLISVATNHNNPGEQLSNGDNEEYRETARLLADKLKQLKQKLEETIKYDIRKLKLYCPKCREYLEPIITTDNRLLCPKCRTQLAQIMGDQLKYVMFNKPPLQ